MTPPSGPAAPPRSASGRDDPAHRICAEVGPKDIGDRDGAVWLLVHLEDRRDDPGQREARPVERVDELRLRALLGPVADRHAPRLVVAEVGARADLEPALDARRPDLEVVLLALHEAHLARAHEEHPVRETQALEEDLGTLGHPLE